jgi:integrase
VERSDGACHGRDDQAEDHEPCADEGKERGCVNEPIDSPDDRKGKEVEDASANAGQRSRRRRRERNQGRSHDDRDKARRDGGGVGDASDHLRDESGGRHQQRDHTSGSEGGPQKPTNRKVGRALRSDPSSRSGLAPATVHKAYQMLSKVLRGAVDAGLLAQTPCMRIELPRIEREEMRLLAPIEIARLADAIDARYRAMVLVGCYRGLRLGEMAGLRRAQVGLDARTIRVVENAVDVHGHIVRGASKTKAGRRTVPVAPTIVTELEHHLENYTPSGGDAPVFAGANPKQIAAWAGHSSVAVVLDCYGHLFEGHESAVLSRLNTFAECVSMPPRDTESRGCQAPVPV